MTRRSAWAAGERLTKPLSDSRLSDTVAVLMLCPRKAYRMSSCFDIAEFMQVSPRLVGLALAQVLSLSGTMQW